MMLTASYGGGVVVELEPQEHRYTVTSSGHTAEMVSVTTALKIVSKGDALANWTVKQTIAGMLSMQLTIGGPGPATPEEWEHLLKQGGVHPASRMEQGGTRGSSMHNALELYQQDRPPTLNDVPDGERAYLTSLAKFVLAHRPVFLASEIPVASLKYGYAGTLDYLRECSPGCLVCDGKLPILGDAKTTGQIWDEAHLQTAAYVEAYEERTGNEICHAEILRLGKDGEFELERSVGMIEDFLAVMDLHTSIARVRLKRKQQRRSFVGHT